MLAVWIVVGLFLSMLVAYGSVLAFLYVRQRSIMYLPTGPPTAPEIARLEGAESLRLETVDGERIAAWFTAAREGQPLLLYFHGNASSLADAVPRLLALVERGFGCLAIDYRGFGGSTGSPSESGLIHDADAAYAAALARVPHPADIVVVGESLGTAVAVALAARAAVGVVVLEAAFSSAVDVAARRYPMFPVRWLLHDRFDSIPAVGRIEAPMLFLHGTLDTSIPIEFGRKLFEAAPQPKTFMAVGGGGHQVMQLPDVMQQMVDWIAANRRPTVDQPPMREAPLRAT